MKPNHPELTERVALAMAWRREPGRGWFTPRGEFHESFSPTTNENHFAIVMEHLKAMDLEDAYAVKLANHVGTRPSALLFAPIRTRCESAAEAMEGT